MVDNKRILIIDDEPDIREVAKLCLGITRASWEVLTAGSGEEGITAATAHTPDAILLDMVMPDMDGLLTLKTLKANPATEAIPVIILTAIASSALNADNPEATPEGILDKPFDPGTLGEDIEAKLGWSSPE